MLLTFLSAFFIANAQKPVFEKVSVDISDTLQPIMLQWAFDSAIFYISITYCTNECDKEGYNKIDTVRMDIENLVWKYNDADSKSSQLYFTLFNVDGGGQTNPQNNMVLEAKVSSEIQSVGCPNAVTLSWNPYINMIDSIDYYSVLYKTKGDENFELFQNIPATHYKFSFNSGDFFPTLPIVYEVTELQPNLEYNFVIEAVNKTKTISVFSNIANATTGSLYVLPVEITLARVDVVDDTYFQIEVVTDNFTDPFHKLYLLRDKPRNEPLNKDFLSFTVIDSAEYHTGNYYLFKDENVNPSSGLYYYMAIADNNCKIRDTSNILTNIYLYGSRVEKYKDSIFFTQKGFIRFDPPEPYDLLRIVNDDQYPIVSNLTIENNKTLVDVLPFMDDGIVAQYQIRAFDDSYSNRLSIEHEPVIDFPNAFYPKSKEIENRTFYPIIKFPSEDHYLFIIYNRWGQEVYRSTLPPIYADYANPQGRWDGTFQGKECPAGIYAFKISFSYNEGSGRYSETGSIVLVR